MKRDQDQRKINQEEGEQALGLCVCVCVYPFTLHLEVPGTPIGAAFFEFELKPTGKDSVDPTFFPDFET